MALYKTITLELLQERTHPVTMELLDRFSAELRDLHQEAIQSLSRQGISPTQMSSEAMEMAIHDLKNRLEIEYPTQPGTLNLADAMAFIKRHTPPT
jgi:hypothetical protein